MWKATSASTPTTIRAYLVIRPGKNFGSQEEDESLKALFETGLFSDVNLERARRDARGRRR